jgi:uncharacterized caspase-like protein
MGRRGGFPAKSVLAILTVMACCSTSAIAEKRVALVIGNGAYKNVAKLPNPPNDAQDVAAALKRTGFDTILALDVDKARMDEADIHFARSARDADIALFYYSGHAIQYNGINYLIPVDAKLTDEADLRRMARVDDLVADLQQARNLRILILDSCRNNPFVDDLKRSIGLSRGASVQHGLAKVDNPQGMIVSFATQAGRTAEDGQGRNSPYTTAFLKNIETSEEIGTVFRRIADDVYQSTNKTQLPEVSLSVIGEFYLKGKLRIDVDRSAEGAAAPRVTEAAQAWMATRETSSQAVLEAFIKQFGGTVYGDMARARLEEVKKNQSAAGVPASPPAPAMGEAIKVARTVKSGIESLLVYERAWDRNCNPVQSTVTFTSRPTNGTAWVAIGTSIVPESTLRGGSTGACAGKTITGNQVMYRSNPGFHGVDTVTYDVVNAGGIRGSMIITINAQ